MTEYRSRVGNRGDSLPQPMMCDLWLADGQRFGDEFPSLDKDQVLGSWPDDLETDAFVRLAQTVEEMDGIISWDIYASKPPIAQKLAERARLQLLDIEIHRNLSHLQHVCHRPRLHLRVEDERLPVSRARRSPARAVAELVSHPGDWEHRTFRSIQPSRILARQIEDEWNLYENRVVVRLVDHLLAYLAKRLEELRKIKEIIDASKNYSEEMHRTSFRRAYRISELWSSVLDSKTEDELKCTIRILDVAQRDTQMLLDAPLYKRIPRQQSVPISLKPTNILINDPHYRKIAALWRAWSTFGHKRQETRLERAARMRREATAWDSFALHLVIRAFSKLGWSSINSGNKEWNLEKKSWAPVTLCTDNLGLITLQASSKLRILPLCANLSHAKEQKLLKEIEVYDAMDGTLAIVHVGTPAPLADVDRASGWSFKERTIFFACSPWGIDSEERMMRLLNGWLSRFAICIYPFEKKIPDLPGLPPKLPWLKYQNSHLVAFRAPNPEELKSIKNWVINHEKHMVQQASQAKAAKQAIPIAPRNALNHFQTFLLEINDIFHGLDLCPVCEKYGSIEPRPGKKEDGSDATWWAKCSQCDSEWGFRPCTACSNRYRALAVGSVKIETLAHETSANDWPDKILGRDVWAQPCGNGTSKHYRCPECGTCSFGKCSRCWKDT